MTDWQTLYLIVCALYVLERVLWLPAPAIVFQHPIVGKWRVSRGGWALAAFGVRAFLSPFLPPFGRVLVCENPQIGISPRGFWLIANDDSDLQEEFQSGYFRFTDTPKIRSQGNKVTFDGRAVARFTSLAVARHMVAFLIQLAASTEEERPRLIETEHQRTLDCDRIRKRLSSFREQSRLLGWACHGQFVLLFLLFPLLAQQLGFRAIWLPVLGCLVLSGLYVARTFHRVHRALYGTHDPERGSATATFLLSPVSAACAADELQKHAVGAFHPIAVAAVLCERRVFEAEATRELRSLLFPLPFSERTVPQEFQQEIAWFRRQWQAAVEQFIAETVDDPARLLTAPQKEAEECRSYCPRCASQYLFMEGLCSECLLPVVAFDKSGGAG